MSYLSSKVVVAAELMMTFICKLGYTKVEITPERRRQSVSPPTDNGRETEIDSLDHIVSVYSRQHTFSFNSDFSDSIKPRFSSQRLPLIAVSLLSMNC